MEQHAGRVHDRARAEPRAGASTRVRRVGDDRRRGRSRRRRRRRPLRSVEPPPGLGDGLARALGDERVGQVSASPRLASTRSTLGSARRGSTARQRRRQCGRGGKETRSAHVDLVRDTGARSGDVDAGRRPARPACLHAAPQSPLGVRARRVRVSRAAPIDPADSDEEITKRVIGLDDRRASARLGLPSGGLRIWIGALREAFEEAGILLATPEPGAGVADDRRARPTPAVHLNAGEVRAGRRARRAPPRARRERGVPLLALAHTRGRAPALRHLVPRRARARGTGGQPRRRRARALRMGAAVRRARPVRGGRSRSDLPDVAHVARARVVRDRRRAARRGPRREPCDRRSAARRRRRVRPTHRARRPTMPSRGSGLAALDLAARSRHRRALRRVTSELGSRRPRAWPDGRPHSRGARARSRRSCAASSRRTPGS